MNLDPTPPWNNPVQGLRDAQTRVVNAASKIAADGVSDPAPVVELLAARTQLKANAKVVRTLDQTLGSLIDTLG